MKRQNTILLVGIFTFLFISSVFSCNSQLELKSPIIVEEDQFYTSYEINDQHASVFIKSNKPGIIFDSAKFIESFTTVHSVQSIEITIINSDNLVVEGVQTEPLIVQDSNNVTIRNGVFSDFKVNNSIYTVITLENCPNSVIENCVIQNISANSSSIIGIHLINSDNTTVQNSNITDIVSTATGFLTSFDAYGIILNNSNNISLNNLILQNISSTVSSYGVYAENTGDLGINDSTISDISSKSSFGVYLDICDSSSIFNTSITDLSSASFDSSAIFASNCPFFDTSKVNISSVTGALGITGIDVMNSASARIFQNSITTLSGGSFSQKLAAVSLIDSPGGNITLNSIIGLESSFSEALGINVENSDSTSLQENHISAVTSSYDSAIGIQVVSSSSSEMRENTIVTLSSTGYGIYLASSSMSVLESNTINETDYWIYTDDTSPNVIYTGNIIDGIQSGLQSFTRPSDLYIEEGESESIIWAVSNLYPATYTIWRNGQILLDSINWLFDPLPISTADLVAGEYEYTITFTEQNGLYITDSIWVSVSESESPMIIERPENNLYYQLGSPTNYLLSWNVTDDRPGTYSIYRNSTEVAYDTWTSYNPININVGGLYLGVYNYTIVIRDNGDNSISDIVYVRVLEATTLIIDRNIDGFIEFEVDSTGHFLNWTVQSIEGGTYNIYQDSVKTATETFTPGIPIEFPIDYLGIGTYSFTIEVIDNAANIGENSVTVKVVSRTTSSSSNTTETTRLIPTYTIPTYIPASPTNDLSWLGIIGLLGGLGLIMAGGYLGYQRINLPESIKTHKKALRQAKLDNNKPDEAFHLGEIGRRYLEAGNYRKAIKYNLSSLGIYKALDDKEAQTRELKSLEEAFKLRQDSDIAKSDKISRAQTIVEDASSEVPEEP